MQQHRADGILTPYTIMEKKTTEDKIDEIHTAVIQMKATMEADKTICANVHATVNSRIDGLHKKIAGNGQPGIEKNLETQTRRLDRLETRIIAYATVAMMLVQAFGPKVLKKIGWDTEPPQIVYVQATEPLKPGQKIAIK